MPYRVSRAPWLGLALTLAVLALAEIARDTPIPPLVSVTLLILALVPVAYSALSMGLAWGAASAALVAAYTLHFTSDPGALLTPKPDVFSGGLVMLFIGVGTAVPMSLLRRRERRLVLALEARAADLAARNAELTEANAALEAFGFVVSHDLKEPVRAIENYLDAAREEYKGSEEGRQLLEDAYVANRRLHRLLEGLLAYSRASTSATTPRDLDVRTVLESDACRIQYAGLVGERRATLEVDDAALPSVRADEVILAQLLGNLVLNAVRHNRSPRPTVRVTAVPEPERNGVAHLVVEDNGPGFPPDVLTRFAQLRSTRPATVKGGFGLVIAHRAAHRLDGRIWLENLPDGKGARVHVELPRAAAPAGAPPRSP